VVATVASVEQEGKILAPAAMQNVQPAAKAAHKILMHT